MARRSATGRVCQCSVHEASGSSSRRLCATLAIRFTASRVPEGVDAPDSWRPRREVEAHASNSFTAGSKLRMSSGSLVTMVESVRVSGVEILELGPRIIGDHQNR